MHVLIVDDDKIVCRALRVSLERAEHTVEVVHDGYAALALLKHTRPSVVLLDIFMAQGPDGRDVLVNIRREARLADVPVAILTGGLSEDDHRMVYELGADAFLLKPVTPVRVIHRLEWLHERGRKRTEPIHGGPTE